MGGIKKPYYRIYRQGLDDYALDLRYANDRHLLRRSYKLLEADLITLFSYIEPTDKNEHAFSHRAYEILLRAATEFETNCKRILIANKYSKKKEKDWTIEDYQKIDQATKISEYQICLDVWSPNGKIFQPLSVWKEGSRVGWYESYNKVKHHRSEHFERANLLNVVNAVGAVFAVLYAQFGSFIFGKHHDSDGLTLDDKTDFEYSDDTLFSIKPFSDWTVEEVYDFQWPLNDTDPFQCFNFK